MRLKILMLVLLFVTCIQANVKINTKQDVRNAYRGISYLTKQEKNNVKTLKLSRYLLAQKVEKPSIFSSDTPIYNLYLTSILHRGKPVWLEDDTFVLHMSSGTKYLKQLQRLYRKKYNLKTRIYKNPNYRKKSLLREIDTEDITEYIREQIPDRMKKKKKSVKKKAKKKVTIDKPVKLARVATRRDALNVEKGLQYLKRQERKNVKAIKLSRYLLAQKVEKPSIFSSDKPIYNLYLTSMLHGGKPVWLEDDTFVFHMSSGTKYLKQLQRLYRKKYNLKTRIYKNPNYRKKSVLRKIDTENIDEYIHEQTPAVLMQKISHYKSRRALKEKRKRQKIARNKKLKKEKKNKEKERLLNIKKQAEKKKKEKRKVIYKKRMAKEKEKNRIKKKKILAKQKSEIKYNETLADKQAKERIKLLQEAKAIEKKRELEEKIWDDKKRKLKEEREQLEKEKRILQEEKQARKNKRLKLKEQEIKRLKKLAQEKEYAERKRKKEKAAAIKAKNVEDSLTSDIDKMMKETSDFKKKLERSESIKYY